MIPRHIQALGAAGATLGLVHGLLTNATVGAELRATLPPEVLAELLARVETAGKMVDEALTEYQQEQMRAAKN